MSRGKCVRFQGEVMQEPHLTRPVLFLLVQIMVPIMPCVLFLRISVVSDQADVLFLLGHPFTLASDFAEGSKALPPHGFSSFQILLQFEESSLFCVLAVSGFFSLCLFF